MEPFRATGSCNLLLIPLLPRCLLRLTGGWRTMLAADSALRRRRYALLGMEYEASSLIKSPGLVGLEASLVCLPPRSPSTAAEASPRVLALSAARRHKRPYLADQKPPFQHFYPKKLFITVARGCLIAALQPLHTAMQQINDELNKAEEEDDDGDIVWPDWKELFRDYHYVVRRDFLHVATANIVRNLSVSSIQRALEALAVGALEPRWANKFVKDAVLSAERKAARSGKYQAALAMLSTSAYASTMINLANFIYDLLQVGYDLLVERYPQLRFGPPVSSPRPLKRPLRKRLVRIVLVNVTSYAVGTCGMAVGTYVYPGLGTTVGGCIADVAQMIL